MSKNKFQLIGNVGNEPELVATENSQYCRITLATSQYIKPKNKDPYNETTWHNLTFWGKQAEFVSKYIQKGRLVVVEGMLKYRDIELEGKKYTLPNLQPLSIDTLTKKPE